MRVKRPEREQLFLGVTKGPMGPGRGAGAFQGAAHHFESGFGEGVQGEPTGGNGGGSRRVDQGAMGE
jgi:hypothetical protein